MTHKTRKDIKLTQSQLKVWNLLHYKTFGISFNEIANEERGLPNKATRDFLRMLHSDTFGICYPSAPLRWKQVKEVMENENWFRWREIAQTNHSLPSNAEASR